MEAGKLRHKITIQRRQETRGELGGVTLEWVDWLVGIRAEVLILTTREQWMAQQIAAEIDARIRIRYRPGIDATMRVKHQRASGSPSVIDYFDIVGEPVDIAGRHRELHLMCTKHTAEGFRTGEPS